jgi:hypothetical protein
MGFNGNTPLIERFESSYIPEPNSGCWLWTAAISVPQAGACHRPVITHQKKQRRAYRVAYELFVGPIPEGAYVCHHCDTPLCVNPDHLYAGSARTNSDDAMRRGRHTAQRYRKSLSGATP